MERSDFYVYLHLTKNGPGKGDVFYVGKGSRRRAGSRTGRSKKWIEHVAIHDFTVEIAQDGMKERDAFLLERWLIAKFKNEGHSIINIASGGQGCSGRRLTDEHKELLSKLKTGVPMSEEFREACRRRTIGNTLRRGKKASEETRKKISIAKSGDRGTRYDHTRYLFANDLSGEIFDGTRYDFCLKYKAKNSGISKLRHGLIPHYKRWRIYLET